MILSYIDDTHFGQEDDYCLHFTTFPFISDWRRSAGATGDFLAASEEINLLLIPPRLPAGLSMRRILYRAIFYFH